MKPGMTETGIHMLEHPCKGHLLQFLLLEKDCSWELGSRLFLLILIIIPGKEKLLFNLAEQKKMNHKSFNIAFAVLFFVLSGLTYIYAWGNKAHRLVNGKAIEILPEEMNVMKSWKGYIVEHASDADIRRDNGTDTTEAPKHFIDLDFYAEFLNGKMIKDKNKLIKVYGEETIVKMGLLPWAILDTYNNLKKSFMEKNRDKVLIYTSDLGHYVADAHQPFHTVLNYDGQLTDQKGIHGRYESEMLNRYIDQISNSLHPQNVKYIPAPLDYIFDFLTASNSLTPVILNADKLAFEITDSHGTDDYYRLMWFRTKSITIDQLSKSAEALASLIYSAWLDAGKPDLSELN
jgi:hypothetical protein